MAEEGHTDATEFLPEVQDREDGTFCITLNPYYPSLPILEDGLIGLEFRDKVSMKEADDFAKLFHKMIKSISYTTMKDAGKRERVKRMA